MKSAAEAERPKGKPFPQPKKRRKPRFRCDCYYRYFPTPKRPYETGDIWKLTDKEFRVYHYLCWKTWGFNKEWDAISLSQMHGGIVDNKGTVKQAGTGYSVRTLIRILKSLDDKGWIRRKRNGSRPTLYSVLNPLLFDDPPSEVRTDLSCQVGYNAG